MWQDQKISRVLDLLYTQEKVNIDLALILLESWEEGRLQRAKWIDLAKRVGLSFEKLFSKSLFLRHVDEQTINSLVEQLPRFEKLSFMRGRLPSLPASLRSVSKLKLLYCFETQMKTLPDWIGEWQELEYLSVIGGFLSRVPKGLSRLRKLKGLSIRNTHLQELCDFSELQQLSTLDIPQNNLHKLSTTVARLRLLTDLYLEHNYIEYLPEELQALKGLRRLTLGHNRLREWPVHLYFPQLITLSLEHNSLVHLPETLFQQEKLRYLNIAANPLETLPDLWHQLRHLEELDLSHYKADLPPSLWRCTSLKRLCLDRTSCPYFPAEAQELPKLRELVFRGHKLQGLPNPFPQFLALEKLDLSSNGLKQLPKNISSLFSLKVLNLRGNPLSRKEQQRIRAALPKVKVFLD